MERKPLFWIRSSRRDLKEFPEDVLDVVGRALDEAHWGRKPHEAKPWRDSAAQASWRSSMTTRGTLITQSTP
jgi:phage-related protein